MFLLVSFHRKGATSVTIATNATKQTNQIHSMTTQKILNCIIYLLGIALASSMAAILLFLSIDV